MKKIGILLASLIVFSACTSTDSVTESIQAVKKASEKTHLLENGAYTNTVKQTMQDMSVENIVDGIFIKKDKNYDWYMKLILSLDGDTANHTVSEVVQIDSIQKSRFSLVDEDELGGWAITSEESKEDPPNLFFHAESLPSKKYVEKLEVSEDEYGMLYTFIMNNAYGDVLTKEGVTQAEKALKEAKQSKDTADSITILEENIARVAAINYDNITLSFIIDEEGVLVSHQTTMVMLTNSNGDEMETTASMGTSITDYNNSEIEEQIPHP
ncbi:hypothetical protein [Jeotgalibaca sp. A127]|uniref:hypothetical protein n=1 Tax=Jeotgalibaca sp. A127 TaxID=3457324 RepID=UPI003FD2A9EF